MTTRRLLVVLAAVLAAPSAAFAHRLLVAASAGPVEVVVTVRYDAGDPGEAGTMVTLTDAAGAVIASAATDDAGRCRLPRPRPGAYTLTADDGAGHREAIPFVVPAEEVETAAGSAVRDRWVTTLAGLAVIAGGTVLVRWFLRRKVR